MKISQACWLRRYKKNSRRQPLLECDQVPRPKRDSLLHGEARVSHAPVVNLHPFSVPRILGLGMTFFHFRRIGAIHTNFYMELRRSQRQPKPRTIWEERGAPSAARDPKITKRTDRTEQKTALKPVAIGSLPETLELDVNQLHDLPAYKPPLELRFEPSKSLLEGLSELDTFQTPVSKSAH